jgi:hypothetical protein
MVLYNELERNGKEAIVTFSKPLSQNSYGETEELDENSQKKSVSRPGFELGPFRILGGLPAKK